MVADNLSSNITINGHKIENCVSLTSARVRLGLPLMGGIELSRRSQLMDWETPSFEEIEMNAEIGSYQGDNEDSDYNGL